MLKLKSHFLRYLHLLEEWVIYSQWRCVIYLYMVTLGTFFIDIIMARLSNDVF